MGAVSKGLQIQCEASAAGLIECSLNSDLLQCFATKSRSSEQMNIERIIPIDGLCATQFALEIRANGTSPEYRGVPVSQQLAVVLNAWAF